MTTIGVDLHNGRRSALEANRTVALLNQRSQANAVERRQAIQEGEILTVLECLKFNRILEPVLNALDRSVLQEVGYTTIRVAVAAPVVMIIRSQKHGPTATTDRKAWMHGMMLEREGKSAHSRSQ